MRECLLPQRIPRGINIGSLQFNFMIVKMIISFFVLGNRLNDIIAYDIPSLFIFLDAVEQRYLTITVC